MVYLGKLVKFLSYFQEVKAARNFNVQLLTKNYPWTNFYH